MDVERVGQRWGIRGEVLPGAHASRERCRITGKAHQVTLIGAGIPELVEPTAAAPAVEVVHMRQQYVVIPADRDPGLIYLGSGSVVRVPGSHAFAVFGGQRDLVMRDYTETPADYRAMGEYS